MPTIAVGDCLPGRLLDWLLPDDAAWIDDQSDLCRHGRLASISDIDLPASKTPKLPKSTGEPTQRRLTFKRLNLPPAAGFSQRLLASAGNLADKTARAHTRTHAHT
eukprot:CAMPEP_0115752058 /NCGR_PEP_ID=MMETSP0272-20121206/95590_1 /TAXON_ID=71861 /ORGANISM="Scrippsiella trochoidea, Strain CCMP3099" /LENGTH=105 /DNA_ID=CAMNT_0003197285 /DNA_START=129 /DNA_END=443 /DNA_ORIENTATION=-